MKKIEWPAEKIRRCKLTELRAFEKNSRTHSEAQIDQIINSIKQWGWTNPVLISEDNRIIAGHGRCMAAERMGIDEVPVMVAAGWSEDQIRAYVIADNQLAMNAGWNKAILTEEIKGLEAVGFDISLIGFTAADLGDFLAASNSGITDPNAAPELRKRVISKSGDRWSLGDHVLMVGDATQSDDVKALVGDDLVDCVWTDPPYNVNYEGTAGKIINDSMGNVDFQEFLGAAMRNMFAVMKPGAAIYVAHADTEGRNFRSAFEDSGFKLSGCLIWKKNALVLGRSDYQWQHEPILYGWKPGASHRWFGGRKNTTIQDIGDGAVTQNEDGSLTLSIGECVYIIKGDNLSADMLEPTVIPIRKPKANPDHPTMKPVELVWKQIENSTRGGDIVLDTFGGSGSTLIVCEQHGRKCRVMEFDPKFADVIIRRWQDFTGRSAIRNGKTFAEVENGSRQKAKADSA